MFFAPILRPIALITFTIHNHAGVAQRVGGSRFFAANSCSTLDSGRSTGLLLPQKGSKFTKFGATGPPPVTLYPLLPCPAGVA